MDGTEAMPVAPPLLLLDSGKDVLLEVKDQALSRLLI